MKAYYNENDRRCAEWLRELIKEGVIPDGWVDERSIVDVKPHELRDYEQQHFFAGVGGWACALRLAGWPEDRPVRTGSCPCQPFSIAGRQGKEKDERHLWPVFRDLITFGEPAITFGEQVASPAGRDWLAGVRADLEGIGYEVGAADLPAACVGAPHIRQRLWWVAHAGYQYAGRRAMSGQAHAGRASGEFAGCGERGRLGDAGLTGLEGRNHGGQRASKWDAWSPSVWLPCGDGKTRRIEPGLEPMAHGVPGRVGLLRGYGNAIVPQLAAAFIETVMEILDQ